MVRCFRDQNLPPVARGANPGGAMHVEAEVAAGQDDRVPRVKSHSRPHPRFYRPRMVADGALGIDRGEHGLPSVNEHHSDAVAFSTDFTTTLRAKDTANELFVLGEHPG